MDNKKRICDIIIFGGHGDLSFRKLLPAVYHLYNDAYINEESRIIIISRKKITLSEHKKLIKEKLIKFLPKGEFDDKKFSNFEKQLKYCKIDFNDETNYKNLKKILDALPKRDRVYYFSTSSDFYGKICENLHSLKFITKNSRVVLEKPIGLNLESSKIINAKVLEYFEEQQIFRIDHYLGKDTVQNILALRFSNRIFMPLWDASNIDHVQITVAESVGVEERAGYYDEYGALRDMIQNHLMQLLCLIAMEPPCSLYADDVRDEKVKVLKSLKMLDAKDVELKTVRAQYTQGQIDGKIVQGYTQNKDLQESKTETFVAIKVEINNWRWNGVPFYIRSGKRLKRRNSEIVIQFKSVPYSIFHNNGANISENKLVITLQPNESIQLELMNKIPGLSKNMKLQRVALELNNPINQKRKSSAYERLLLDVVLDNATLFMRLDEVEAAWKWADKIIEGWEENSTPMRNYTAGTDGPSAAIELIARDGRSWHDECC
ncbi:MAG: glucose-6-phosphate dehydrogenase [Campylobacteraceae bacterium]|nr:glucose-6-phosphate dehydrogenase [Campylobacteraceae bacterium]